MRHLGEAVERYGKPEEVLTDHGSQYYSVRGGVSAFTRTLQEMGIRHILAGVGRPTTIGKVERWFGVYEQEAWRYGSLEAFLQVYNHESPT